jgi:hypothetical protein
MHNEFAINLEQNPIAVKSAGECHMSVPAGTSIAGVGTYYKIAGTTIADNLVNFTMPENNRLQCNDAIPKKYLVLVTGSCYVSSSTVSGTIAISKNGFIDTSNLIRTTMGSASIQPVALTSIVEMSTGDWIEIAIANNTDTKTITFQHLNVTIIEFDRV